MTDDDHDPGEPGGSDPDSTGTAGAAGPRVTRRGALAVGGAALLAGCGVPNLLGSDSVTIDGRDLERYIDGERPRVTEPLPVDVQQTHVAASRERAHSLLAAAPLPLSAEDLPNGAMREQVHHHAEHAREHLAEAVETTGTRERLDMLAHARGPARSVAATWAYTQNDLTLDDVQNARLSVRDDLGGFREEREYVGAEPVRAVVVHGVVDEWLEEAERDAAGERGRDDERATALEVGDRAADVEEARASLADARHVHEQFVGSLSAPSSVRETIVDARDSLAATIDERTSAVMPETDEVDADRESPVLRIALAELYDDLPEEFAFRDTAGPAAAVVGQANALATVHGFESLRERVEGGDYPTVESAEDVRDLRERAVTAIEAALAESPDELLARTVLSSLAGWFEYADRDLTGYDDAVELDRLRRDLAIYPQLEARAEGTPNACEDVLATFDEM